MRPNRSVVASAVFTLFFGLTAAAATLGAGVTAKEVVKVSAILENPTPYVGKTVVVEGTIVDVCAARGCWIDLAGDKPHQKLRIKVDDGVIVFPMESRGKKARVQGKVEELKLTRDEALQQAKHHAEETGKPFDAKSAQGPLTQYRLRATGALLP